MLKLKEGLDYHIKEMGNCLELSSMSLAGFTAGVVELTRRSYEINLEAIIIIGMLRTAKTIPKIPKSKTVKKKSPAKVVTKKE